MIIDNQGYVIRTHYKKNWFLIKYNHANSGTIRIGYIHFPKHLIGKKVRLKIEIIHE